MRTRMFLTIMSVLSLLISTSAMAHISEPGGVLPHVFTGEHLLILVLAGVCVAGVSKLYQRLR